MRDKDVAMIKKIVEKGYPGSKAEKVVPYLDDYTFIVLIKHPEPDEADYDPFIKVDVKAQTVEDFSIIHDADDPAALLAKFQEAK